MGLLQFYARTERLETHTLMTKGASAWPWNIRRQRPGATGMEFQAGRVTLSYVRRREKEGGRGEAAHTLGEFPRRHLEGESRVEEAN